MEYWIFKGESGFTDNKPTNYETFEEEPYDATKGDQFYDLVSLEPMVGGIHVIEKAEYDKLKAEYEELKERYLNENIFG